ncbi:uncharacterized protein LOC734406 isoform X1 [Xenopus laevis]|uniref:Tetraspanin n=2 Tax=Xenopus laevis TaxID=8355 RepID=Q569S1_XENLA|nr:uncharacterized protein LOC734406 [Xenopus laevis]XP_018103943.1 uncharacterized protein LOC734406 isoform X1 [Xenopus laevis]AAH92329.1 MGC115024 protein [Xenopus laevis]OCT91621.1 hypothetical protein XELAEV_18014681mg [Xenopus laevis]
MGSNFVSILKYSMFAFNFLFWVTGCSIIAIGIYFVVNNIYRDLLPNNPSLTVGNVLIAIGIIIMVFGFLGCMGAIKENKCLLLTFFILLLLILLAEVIMAIFLYVYEKQLDNYVKETLTNSFEQNVKRNSSEAWDMIQQNLQCCGINGTHDWGKDIPNSCCPNSNCSSRNVFTVGCSEALKKWFDNNFLYVGVGTICISVIEVLAMSFALTLYCHISKSSGTLST